MAITVSQLAAFLAVVRCGSVTAAAQELEVTQPSVSSAVTALSRELDCDLLERAGRGIQPTPAGREFASYASDVVGLLDSGRRAAREAARRASRELRVAASATAAETFLPALLRQYSEAHPQVESRLTVSSPQDVVQAVLDHAADLAIIGQQVDDQRLSVTSIRSGRMACVTAASDRLAGAAALEAVDVAALRDRVWLLREHGSSTRLASERLLARHAIQPETLTLGSNAAIKQAVIAGLGVALLAGEIVGPELAAGALSQLQLADGPPRQRWYLLQSAIGPSRPVAADFLELCLTDETTAAR